MLNFLTLFKQHILHFNTFQDALTPNVLKRRSFKPILLKVYLFTLIFGDHFIYIRLILMWFNLAPIVIMTGMISPQDNCFLHTHVLYIHIWYLCRDHLCMRSANERRRYYATPPLVGWTHFQNDLCVAIVGMTTCIGSNVKSRQIKMFL